jgi:hypothetical protein
MPKVEIDYSNTVIYKITCNDPNVTDSYVGHTTNFVQRKSAHKNGVTNEKSPCYNLKLYRTIRDNGGWDSWKMEMVQFYNCKNIYEAKIKEQEHYTELKASLNSIEPMKPKEIAIDTDTIRNKVVEASEGECEVSKFNYKCEKCDYKCNNKTSFDKHLSTRKHEKGNIKEHEKLYSCKQCNKSYRHRQGLSIHKKTCERPDKSSDISKLTISIMELVKSTNNLQKQLIEQQQQYISYLQNNQKEIINNGANPDK